MAFICMFSFANSNILSLVSATSWPGDIGCCGNWESRGGEGRESSLSFFPVVFLENAFFQVRTCQEETRTGYAHRCGQWAHMQQTQEVIAIFDFWPWNLECGWNAVFSCLLSKSRMFSSSEAQLCPFSWYYMCVYSIFIFIFISLHITIYIYIWYLWDPK